MNKPLLLACLLAGPAGAQDSIQSVLPPVAIVQQILLDSPVIHSARSRQEAQLFRANSLEIGPHEFGVRLNQQTRRVSQPSETFAETMVTLERPVRLWGKTQTDQELAQQTRALARVSYADALHESSRQLLTHWFAAWRTRIERDSAAELFSLAQLLHEQAASRLKHGDISALDAQLALAEQHRAQVQRDLSHSEWLRAQAWLQRLYPGLPLPPELPDPGRFALLEPLDRLRDDYLQKHHELNLWRAEAARSLLLARKAEQERTPDPTLGVFTARERLGAERIVGLSVGIPLPGEGRRQIAQAARSEAMAAADKVRQMELELGAEFERRWASMQDQRRSIDPLATATRIQQGAAEKSLRAFTLGESTMTEVIQHRRMAQDQLRGLRLKQLEILEQLAFIELDLHRLWDFD